MRKKKVTIGSVFRWAILLFFLVITIYPVIWMIFGSLKTTGDFYTNIWGDSGYFSYFQLHRSLGAGRAGKKIFKQYSRNGTVSADYYSCKLLCGLCAGKSPV